MNHELLQQLIKRKRFFYYKNSTKTWCIGFWSKLKYFLVHFVLKIIMGVKQAKRGITVQYVRFIPELILVVALGLGLYTQWSFTEDVTISVIAILGAFVFAISCALQYYFGMEDLGKALFHVWVGCLIGILAFTNNAQLQYVTMEEVMEAMFITSMVLGWFWNILERLLKLDAGDAKMLTISEGLESTGLIIASIVTGVDSIALSLYTLAYIFHITAMRLKSFTGFISFVSFICVGIFLFFPALEVKPNIYALTCFVGRHAFQPVIDFYFCGLSMIDRWRSYFSKPRVLRYLYLVLLFLLQLVLAVVVGVGTSRHKEWFIVFPLYMALAVVWLMFHLMFFITCWKLMGKVTECNASAENGSSFKRIMAAKGLRYFGLVSQRIIFLSLITNVLVFVIGFETRTPYTLALVFLVLPLECAIVSLFWELGDNLGGTCTGYAVISPVTALRQGVGAQLLSSADVQDIGSRGASTLGLLQQLFSYHMIQNFGCDYSSSGLELDSLQNKLKAFFDRRTNDGPRFDTYILYYSGDVYDTGDWALADKKNLSLSMLLNLWQEKDKNSGSRLILVLDTSHSFKWVPLISSITDCFVALQTCRYISRPETAESGDKSTVGSFTKAYVQFNNGQEVDIDWTTRSRPLRACYRVSSNWSDFSFHLPTREDVESYWRLTFPSIMKPLMKVLNLPSLGSPFCCCRCFLSWLRWLQMRLLPPAQLDTGHGLQLLNT
ncbi:transmembrane protein 168-like [Physella acuta]|uniref:transmembrane protein 168-like n=1 Tax=Physella acuta TaxID=109671 RepID=UPI0027DCF865|nr:transmembrane protein 168-like [Physella acuta]XP_059166710.1 transmembrane protein 168-like [Physella acuta]